MSTSPSEYCDPWQPPPPRPAVNLWPALVLLLLVAGLVWYFWPRANGNGGLNPEAVARAVTPRGDLGEAEKSIIAVYQKASLNGRAELSAFFLEELLLPGLPPTPSGNGPVTREDRRLPS